MVARTTTLLLASLALLDARPATTALKGVWLSIESPVNPFVDENRGVLLIVHSYWMKGPLGMTIEGRAEGTVNGQRQTVPLTFQDRGEGAYALAQSWPGEGRWALVITGRNRGQQATALVRIGEDKKVAGVMVTLDKSVSDSVVVAALR
ncbi:MAG TPA: hypothetical protein VEV39_15355 [Gemmatimonadales bacterium]|nr:hypothetical protein [Gemmatimonadales bacterium]